MRTGVRLGIDVGKARIGVARCDLHGMLATPVETVPRAASGGGDIARICCNVKLGLPLFGKTLMNRDSGDGTTLDEPPQLRHAWPHIQTNV